MYSSESEISTRLHKMLNVDKFILLTRKVEQSKLWYYFSVGIWEFVLLSFLLHNILVVVVLPLTSSQLFVTHPLYHDLFFCCCLMLWMLSTLTYPRRSERCTRSPPVWSKIHIRHLFLGVFFPFLFVRSYVWKVYKKEKRCLSVCSCVRGTPFCLCLWQ